MYEFLGTNNETFSGGNIVSLQSAILENGCQLRRFGADGSWGRETEDGVRCLIQSRGRGFVVQSWPWVAQRMSLPEDSSRGDGVEQAVPWWFSWVAAGIGLVSIIAVGSILTRGK